MSQGLPAGAHSGPKHESALIVTLTLIAALGGLLFGYDTAVISGATDSIKENFVVPLGLPESAALSLGGWTISCALFGCIIGGALGGVVAHALGRRGGLMLDGTLFFAGEATDTSGATGTVHGAIASGARAASQVLRSLRTVQWTERRE